MDAFSYWVGLDTPGATETDLHRFNEFYWSTHVPEVMANNPGFTSCERFELAIPDERGDFGPRWLARYTMSDSAAEKYIEDNSAPGYVMPYTAMPELGCEVVVRWRLLWRHLISSGEASRASKRIRLIGMDPEAESTEDEVRGFNDFYNDIHMVEAREILSATHVSRYELVRNFCTDQSPAPRYAAFYELEEPKSVPSSALTHLSSGPPSWENRNTHWRLEYARMGTGKPTP